MDLLEFFEFGLWVGLFTVLIRRVVRGPQKLFAKWALALLWIGEAAALGGAIAASVLVTGWLLKGAGYALVLCMYWAQWNWAHSRHAP